jgi:hypothetical protein
MWKFTKPDTLVQPGTSGDFDNDEGPLWDDTDRLPEDCLVDGVF